MERKPNQSKVARGGLTRGIETAPYSLQVLDFRPSSYLES